jgi:hypothetical protein
MAEPDFDDPCELYKYLRRQYLKLLGGTLEVEVEYLANGAQRRVRFASTDINELKQLMMGAYDECQAQTGEPARGRRFAIQFVNKTPRYLR